MSPRLFLLGYQGRGGQEKREGGAIWRCVKSSIEVEGPRTKGHLS